MSIYKPQELRYIKLDTVSQERALFRNYWNDVINQYGIDVVYYRRRSDYINDTSSSAMLYGHNNVAVYDKKSDIRVKVDFNSYDFILNEQGFVPSDNVTMYFAINDFATSFVDDVGLFKNYPITSEAEGFAMIKRDRETNQEYIPIPFETDVYSGEAIVPVVRNTAKENVQIEDVDNPSKKCLSVAYNPYIFRSFATDYRDGYFSLNLYCDYDATTGARVKYKLHGDVLYSDFFQDEEVINKIHPNVGDVVEINYHTNDMDVEQYEITEVISRKPTNSDGLSPFLGKFVYRCVAVRRISSHESSIPTTEDDKNFADNVHNYAKKRADELEDTYDWSSDKKEHDSKYYGGYEKSDAFKESSNGGLVRNIDQIFDYDEWKKDWEDCTLTDGNYNLCKFSDGSRLYTDGANLYWELSNGTIHPITNIDKSKVALIDGKIPEMMYIRVEDGQIVFYTADMDNSVKLTAFENPSKDDFEYFENFSYKDVGYVSNDGYYIFKNNRIALNSFNNKKLVAFDGKNRTEYVIADRG